MRTQLISVVTAALLASGLAQADNKTLLRVSNAAWQEECSGCHLAFPPSLLPAASWSAMMTGLDQHFGSDASLDAPKQQEIAQFLAANAGRREATGTDGRPLLRLTQTAWFRREHRDGHDGITAGIWTTAAVKSPANCGACHRLAAQGDYSERNLHLPN